MAASFLHAWPLCTCTEAPTMNSKRFTASWSRGFGRHGYLPAGATREVYLTGPDDPRGFMTEVVCPILEARTTAAAGAGQSA